ncbi:hypothetical protein [Rosistilla oblonga]|uniref:hypothetical protein n=1 Tax=Rosistilla oblonga TaxID=2527990 RepID=UPI003A97B11C
MTDSQPLFQLATETPWSEAEPPWQWPTIDTPSFTHFPISIPLSEHAIGSLVGALCDPLDLKPRTNTQRILEELADLDSYSLPGGLSITVDGERVVSHGCCSGLEDWRDLLSILDSKSPWMGHDPDPWCEFLDNNIVRFWSTGGTASERSGMHIDCSMQLVSDELANFQLVLEHTMDQLRDWLLLTGASQANKIVETFGQSFAITTDVPLYKTI